jgi:hypothetical protein
LTSAAISDDFKRYFTVHLLGLTYGSTVKSYLFPGVETFEVKFQSYPSLPSPPPQKRKSNISVMFMKTMVLLGSIFVPLSFGVPNTGPDIFLVERTNHTLQNNMGEESRIKALYLVMLYFKRFSI